MPSEAKQLRTDGLLSGEDVGNWRFWIRREWLCAVAFFHEEFISDFPLGYYVALGAIVILTALLLVFHTQIVDWLTPFSQWLHEYVFLVPRSVHIVTISVSLKFGWLVPIGILFVLSFPPVICLAVSYCSPLIYLPSFSVMKLSPYSVVSSGVYGLDLVSSLQVHSSEKSAISSM